MSGGHFNYDQYKIIEIADGVEFLIRNHSYGFSDETKAKFSEAVRTLREAHVYAQRIDWLVSGDDGEETFHKRLKEDLEKLK